MKRPDYLGRGTNLGEVELSTARSTVWMTRRKKTRRSRCFSSVSASCTASTSSNGGSSTAQRKTYPGRKQKSLAALFGGVSSCVCCVRRGCTPKKLALVRPGFQLKRCRHRKPYLSARAIPFTFITAGGNTMGQSNLENDVKQLQKDMRTGAMALDKLESQLKEVAFGLKGLNKELDTKLDKLEKALDGKKDKKTADQQDQERWKEMERQEAERKKEMERQEAQRDKEMERQREVMKQEHLKEAKRAYAEQHKEQLKQFEEVGILEFRFEALEKAVKHLLSQQGKGQVR
jgi:hypothetical protein